MTNSANSNLPVDNLGNPSALATSGQASSPAVSAPSDPAPPVVLSAPPAAQAPLQPIQTKQMAANSDGGRSLDSSIPALRTARGSYAAALFYIGSFFPVPIVVAILTTVLYISSPLQQALTALLPQDTAGWVTIALGALVTLVLWLVLSLPFIGATTFEGANPVSSNHLKSHYSALKVSFEIMRQKRSAMTNHAAEDAALQDEEDDIVDISLEKVRGYLLAVNDEVGRGGLNWITGTGYTNAWNLMHRAEEAMIDIAPRHVVIREALHDELSLKGSAVAARDSVLITLRTAVQRLSPSAAIYLDGQSQAQDNGKAGGESAADTNNANGNGEDPLTEVEAREALHTIRQTINEFRDGLWEGLVRMRNQLFGTAFITALLTYILLGIAVAVKVPAPSLNAAIVFYLVGAMVGLFSRLNQESQADQAIDDFGLTTARAIVMPLLSGLAAIAGVFLVAVLSLTLLKAPTPSAATGSSSIALPALDVIYNLGSNTLGIVVAATFGLTPNLLISTLQQQSESFKAQLKNSSAPDQGKS